jgi:hypothetical protein
LSLLDDAAGARWTSIADLTATEGKIIPLRLADAVVKRGVKDERWEVIEILYGAAAFADLPPVKLIALELDVPERNRRGLDPESPRRRMVGRHDIRHRSTGGWLALVGDAPI